MPTNDTIPSLTTNATLLTALLTLLLPLNALQMIQFLLLQPLLLYLQALQKTATSETCYALYLLKIAFSVGLGGRGPVII